MGDLSGDQPEDGAQVAGDRSSSTLLELIDVSKRFGSEADATAVLDGIDLMVSEGEFVAIKGPSGAGKSTLLHLAAGLDSPSSGQVRYRGRPLDELNEKDLTSLRRSDFGFVFQFFNLVPGLDVRDNIALPMLFAGTSRKLAAQRAENLIETVGLSHRSGHLASKLSGGEMQRTAVARAIAHRPKIVFADEPTGNLDSQNGEQILDLLTELCATDGTALMMVTHDEAAAGRADRVVEVRDGRLAASGGGPSEPAGRQLRPAGRSAG